VTDHDDVAAVQTTLAEHLRERARRPTVPGTAAPLQAAAAYVERLPTDSGPLVVLTASVTRAGDGLDRFDIGPGWSLIGRFDPRTQSVEQLIAAIIETNLEDELAELDEAGEEDR
jgi:hypothetical protein